MKCIAKLHKPLVSLRPSVGVNERHSQPLNPRSPAFGNLGDALSSPECISWRSSISTGVLCKLYERFIALIVNLEVLTKKY